MMGRAAFFMFRDGLNLGQDIHDVICLCVFKESGYFHDEYEQTDSEIGKYDVMQISGVVLIPASVPHGYGRTHCREHGRQVYLHIGILYFFEQEDKADQIGQAVGY